MKKIESRDNKLIKKIKGLQIKKNRDKDQVFVAEGLRFVNHIPKNWNIENYLVTEKFATENNMDLYEENAPVYVVDEKIFQMVSDTENPQGILAVCNRKELTLQEVLKNNENTNHFYVVLEELQDPANVGTILRTSDACGVQGVFLTKGSVDIYNPKVLRGTMGSLFNIPIVQNLNLEDIIEEMNLKNIPTYAMHLKGNEYPYTMDYKKSCCFLVGNEAKGLSSKCEKLCYKFVKLPMIGSAESLNASIATGVMLYEVVRQRI